MLDTARGSYTIGTVHLDLTTNRQVSAYTTFSPTTIHIDYGTAELVADSDAELAFIFGHELGHVIQASYGQLLNTNQELDADDHGIFFLLGAGYEPYAASALFGRMQMLSTVSGVLGNILVDSSAASQHASFSARIDNVMTFWRAGCSGSTGPLCTVFKSIIHPDVPGALPLRAPRRGGVPR
jgi:predicted Zn-dependent protease